MKKVLLLQGTIPHYRIPVFNELAQRVDLTVVHSEGPTPKLVDFKTIYIPTIKIRYYIHKKNILKLAKNFDVVICMFDFSYLYFKLLQLFPHKYKLIYWGIGVFAGYDARYDSREDVAKKFKKRIKRADAMLFYSSYPVQRYSEMGVDRKKLFVANNTVKVLPCTFSEERDSILFIGSLYKQKKIDKLLENYYKAYAKEKEIPQLLIIGDGIERDNIEKWVKEKKLEKKIRLLGQINEDEILKGYFEKAICCISPDQAGLSVLKAMGYGVPYITHKNAITGGEIFNIKNGVNGILLEDFNQIQDIILDCVKNKRKYLSMGKAAQEHYYKNRTVQQMVDGFIDAIDYVESSS